MKEREMKRQKDLRFNLICNGMMLIREFDKDHLEIVIAKEKGHVRKFGAHKTPSQSSLTDIDAGEYTLTGLKSSQKKMQDLFHARFEVMLDPTGLTFDRAAALKDEGVLIKVPKPNLVRYYRGGEPEDTDIVLGNYKGIAREIPQVLHDIVVLSYTNLNADGAVELVESEKGTFAKQPLTRKGRSASPDAFNWALYSNDKKRATSSHSTKLNDYLQPLKATASASNGLQLSTPGAPDGPTDPTSIGMTRLHLCLFHELPTKRGDKVRRSDGTIICTRAVIG
jgi:hypothetical protein